MAFLIDGYNLLRAIQKISDLPSLKELALCRLISDYLKFRGQIGEIIFDGVGPREKAPFYDIPMLDVIFSGRGIEADSVIEEKILTNSAPRLLIVVSSDRRIRFAAKKRKAIAVKSDAFWAELEKFASQSRRRRKKAEPLVKRQGTISEAETEYWLKLFGLKK